MKAGDILRYDRAWSIDLDRDPVWVWVRHVDFRNFQGVYMGGGKNTPAIMHYAAFEPGVTHWSAGLRGDQREPKIAHYRVADPDEVPDHVWGMVAQTALLG